MTETPVYETLVDVITDELFPNVDVRLRAGVHLGREDQHEYAFLVAVEALLRGFYRGYGCDLVHAPEGYYYLLSDGSMLPQRQMSASDMLVGQVLVLAKMDPAYLADGGRVPIERLHTTLEMLLGRKRLIQVFTRRQRGGNEDKDLEKVVEAVAKSLRLLARLGFVVLADGGQCVIPRQAVMRFGAPTRDARDPRAALEELVRTGEITLGTESEEDDESEGDRDGDD
jgi:chromosome partition protein MukE